MPLPDPLAVRRLADKLEPRYRRAILAIIATLAIGPDEDKLVAAIQAADLAAVMRLWEEYLVANTGIVIDIISPLLEESVMEAGNITARVIPAPVPVPNAYATMTADFMRISEISKEWVAHHSASLVTGLTTDARQSVRSILEVGYRGGMAPRWTARQMREVVGLLPSHANAVARYIAHLQRQGFPPEVITRNANLYARRLLTYRTENIARTETITASVAGQVATWIANAEQELLDRHRTWVEWMVTEDDRLCDICAPMDGQRVRIGEMFTSTLRGFPGEKPTAQGPGSRRLARRQPLRPNPRAQPRDLDGRFIRITKSLTERKHSVTVPHPPLHPSCRCALVLRFD